MKASEALKKKVKEFEGVRLEAYKDSGGVWTIGVGHTGGVKRGAKISMAEVNALLDKDLGRVEKFLSRLELDVSQCQFDALCSFVFNLGEKNFLGSTLYAYVCQHKDVAKVQEQFKRWVWCKGVKLPGLVRRREWEAEMWGKEDEG